MVLATHRIAVALPVETWRPAARRWYLCVCEVSAVTQRPAFQRRRTQYRSTGRFRLREALSLLAHGETYTNSCVYKRN